MKKTKKELKVVGWREVLCLVDLHETDLKVKVDSGAKTSSLHAFDLEAYTRRGSDFVKFNIHTTRNRKEISVPCKARVLEYRNIRSSNGQVERRPVIETTVELLDEVWTIELTLTNRDEMGFKMLLGREALKNRFLINPAKSYNCNKKGDKK